MNWPAAAPAEELAAAKNRDRLDVGDTFVLRDRTWIVVGVLKSAGLTFNSEIWAKRSLVAALFGKDTYTTLVLRTEDAAAAGRLKDFLAKDYKKAAVNAAGRNRILRRASPKPNAQFSYAIGFLAVVMSVGGVFGVMNTMFAAISQRIRRHRRAAAVGLRPLASPRLASCWNRWHCPGGRTAGLRPRLAGRRLDRHQHDDGPGRREIGRPATGHEPPTSSATGILLTLLMGLLGGLLPALSAMRLKPLEALR